jgi:hypothetical protein
MDNMKMDLGEIGKGDIVYWMYASAGLLLTL